VSAVCEALRMALADLTPLLIDLSDSGPWDLAGLQLLVSCDQSARSHDQSMRLVAVPEVCAEVAERSGLAEWLASVRE
jgi:anti-anti-sigma regulatory factor